MTILDTIAGIPIYYHDSPEQVSYTSGMMIDGDGSGGNSYGDPDFQPDTSLHQDGAALNAELECYIVVPPAIIQGTRGIVLGCQAQVTYKGVTVAAVVADIGPHRKIGEGSIALAKALGIPESPLTGGVDSGVQFVISPDVPAVSNGKTYSLQPS